jgi:hypothetical protein
MTSTPVTDRLNSDLSPLRNRNYLDPKFFYKLEAGFDSKINDDGVDCNFVSGTNDDGIVGTVGSRSNCTTRRDI